MVTLAVGMAWTGAHKSSPGLELHHKDGRHASPAGAYLTACVFYTVLTRKSPLGLPAAFNIEGKNRPDQDQAQARLLQNAAWETCMEFGSGNAEGGIRKWEFGMRKWERVMKAQGSK